ncbi:unnamed protein product [Litomosoides sigmodontis]|uniref:Methyltransferase type 11 domain-containing protein n=1 Tax=Litomosoides sigmodontis TaxID=42156 RepID=A0A3P6TKS2_LITSI|nr:unnamed protein product [Litomosoides sigmodontis]
MSSLPDNADGFKDSSFWKEFYKDYGNAFEWYGDFKTFGRILVKYLKVTDKILQIGCGSSELASQLYDSGYQKIDNIDTDEGVIQKQVAKNSSRPGLQFMCSSAAKIDVPDEEYNVVVDKGTLDALVPSANEDVAEDVEKMFEEICRVLAIGGRYIVLTLAQKNVLNSYMSFFVKRMNFIIRIEKNVDPSWEFPLPLFFLIATKLRIALPSPYMELILDTEKKAAKFSCQEKLINSICAEQEFSRFCHLCSKKLENEVSLVLYGSDETPRYHLAVLDDPEVDVLNSFAVFIVPVGRDRDWFFATEKGRASLRKQCSKDRLAVVTLYRDQNYESMDQVKDELGSYVTQFTPTSLFEKCKSMVEFLSLGKIDVKETRAVGHSDVNGRWTVEDVVIQTSLFRRLVFLSAQNLVQSEAKVIRNKIGSEIVNLHSLTSEYHEAMLTALPFMLNPHEKLNRAAKRLLVLGLGGGVLPSFLRLKFPSMSVVVVELDPKVEEIAKEWFSFKSDSRLTVVIKDALTYVEELVQKKDKSLLFDAIFIDVAGSTQQDGLSCPLPSFVTEKALKTMYDALGKRGVLALNLVTRDDDVAMQIKDRVLSVFSHYYTLCIEEDINQVLLCPKIRKSLHESQKCCENYKRDKGTLRNVYTNLSLLKYFHKSAN